MCFLKGLDRFGTSWYFATKAQPSAARKRCAVRPQLRRLCSDGDLALGHSFDPSKK